MTDGEVEYPKRDISSTPFSLQLDVIEKTLVEAQNQPLTNYYSNHKHRHSFGSINHVANNSNPNSQARRKSVGFQHHRNGNMNNGTSGTYRQNVHSMPPRMTQGMMLQSLLPNGLNKGSSSADGTFGNYSYANGGNPSTSAPSYSFDYGNGNGMISNTDRASYPRDQPQQHQQHQQQHHQQHQQQQQHQQPQQSQQSQQQQQHPFDPFHSLQSLDLTGGITSEPLDPPSMLSSYNAQANTSSSTINNPTTNNASPASMSSHSSRSGSVVASTNNLSLNPHISHNTTSMLSGSLFNSTGSGQTNSMHGIMGHPSWNTDTSSAMLSGPSSAGGATGGSIWGTGPSTQSRFSDATVWG